MMSERFFGAGTQLDLAPVRDFRQRGGRVVGYTCSFLPVEVLDAAGLLPVRLRGLHAGRLDIADAYYGPFVCTFPKALLQQAGVRDFDFLDGAVVTSGCDGMRRLDECWRKMSTDIDGTLPSWFYYMDVPNKPDGVALEWYENRIRKLIAALEDGFGVRIGDPALREAIQTRNEIRRALWDFSALRDEDPVRISGSEAFEALIARTVLPPDVYLKELNDLIDEVKVRETGYAGKKRVFVTGSICDDLALVKQIEDAGAVVVGESVCYGMRNSFMPIPEEGDPVSSLAAHYLSGSICPRMFGYYPQRRDAILEQVRRCRAQGVILQNIRFCDLHGSENGLLERDLEKQGIPSLRIEKEYGSLTETGRLRMRFDAFFEQLDSREEEGVHEA
jgi:benzoyl-CoA reductase subunit C